jgi:hypothetical protein
VIAEQMDRRVLGALRFVDAVSGLEVLDALAVSSEDARWIRNRRGWFVLRAVPQLVAHEDAFTAPPTTPAIGRVQVRFTVKDPAARYLARGGTIDLPRDPDPAHAAAGASLFHPTPVALFPAPRAPTAPGWAVVRATVSGPAAGTVLAGALLRAVRASDNTRLGSGMTDDRGEALVAIQGIPSTTFAEGAGPVLATDVAARLEVVFDPSAASASPDPDDLEARRAQLLVKSAPVTLASGRAVKVAV